MKLSDLAIADGRVLSLQSDVGGLRVAFEDWQEKRWILLFDDVLGYENLGVEGEDLSHLEETDGKDLWARIQAVAEDDEETEAISRSTCFCFVSAWGTRPLLRVLAAGCEVRAGSQALSGADKGHSSERKP